jgi:hypothetical protein
LPPGGSGDSKDQFGSVQKWGKDPRQKAWDPKKGPTLHGPTWGTCNNVRVPSMFFRQHLRISAGAPAFLDQANDRKIWVCLKVGCP